MTGPNIRGAHRGFEGSRYGHHAGRARQADQGPLHAMTAVPPRAQPDGGEPPDAAIELPADGDGVTVARQMVLGLLDDTDVTAARANEIALAVAEACNNAVQHAYPDGPPGPLRVEGSVRADAIEVTVRDEGGGMHPQATGERMGLGLGMPLMVALADEVTFRARGRNGLSVSMRLPLADGGAGP